jgi:hypothetical protein
VTVLDIKAALARNKPPYAERACAATRRDDSRRYIEAQSTVPAHAIAVRAIAVRLRDDGAGGVELAPAAARGRADRPIAGFRTTSFSAIPARAPGND